MEEKNQILTIKQSFERFTGLINEAKDHVNSISDFAANFTGRNESSTIKENEKIDDAGAIGELNRLIGEFQTITDRLRDSSQRLNQAL